ncbi:MAG TPA: hypothetical protein EYN51_12385 [Flavobacteriales bacterium]|nr:hypothetical protein [Flavobacteriales bacterium]
MSNYPRDYKVWALLANWHHYDSIGAIEAGHDELWSTGGKQLKKDDPILVWQTLDDQGQRGIVGLGVVKANPKIQTDLPSPFVREESTQITKGYLVLELMVDIRYVRLPNGPIWIDGPNEEVALDLTVSRGRGRATFIVTKPQWVAILNAAGMSHEEFRNAAYYL